MYDNGFLSRGFIDRREILHGRSATSQMGFLRSTLGDSPREDGRIMGVNKGRMAGYAFLLKHLFLSETIDTVQNAGNWLAS